MQREPPQKLDRVSFLRRKFEPAARADPPSLKSPDSAKVISSGRASMTRVVSNDQTTIPDSAFKALTNNPRNDGTGVCSAAYDFPSVLKRFGLDSVFREYTWEKILGNNAHSFEAVSIKDKECIWRRVAVVLDPIEATMKMYDLDRKIFISTRLQATIPPSTKEIDLNVFRGLKTSCTSERFKSPSEWKNFVLFHLHGRQAPIVILTDTAEQSGNLGKAICLIQAYQLRAQEEEKYHSKMVMEIEEDTERHSVL